MFTYILHTYICEKKFLFGVISKRLFAAAQINMCRYVSERISLRNYLQRSLEFIRMNKFFKKLFSYLHRMEKAKDGYEYGSERERENDT